MLWRLRTGALWRDLPERYGPWQTVYERFARWETDGTWAKLLEHVQVKDDAVGAVEWTVSVDSTINRAHQHAAGARKKGPGSEQTGRSATSDAWPGAGQIPRRIEHQGPPRGRRPRPALGHRRYPGQVNDSTVFDTCWTRCACPARLQAVLVAGPRRSSPTRRIRHGPSGQAYGAAASERSSLNDPTRSPTDNAEDRPAGGRRPSIQSSTRPAMWSNDASAGSNSSGPWPPASTNWPPATWPVSDSPRSSSGSVKRDRFVRHDLAPLHAVRPGEGVV